MAGNWVWILLLIIAVVVVASMCAVSLVKKFSRWRTQNEPHPELSQDSSRIRGDSGQIPPDEASRISRDRISGGGSTVVQQTPSASSLTGQRVVGQVHPVTEETIEAPPPSFDRQYPDLPLTAGKESTSLSAGLEQISSSRDRPDSEEGLRLRDSGRNLNVNIAYPTDEEVEIRRRSSDFELEQRKVRGQVSSKEHGGGEARAGDVIVRMEPYKNQSSVTETMVSPMGTGERRRVPSPLVLPTPDSTLLQQDTPSGQAVGPKGLPQHAYLRSSVPGGGDADRPFNSPRYYSSLPRRQGPVFFNSGWQGGDGSRGVGGDIDDDQASPPSIRTFVNTTVPHRYQVPVASPFAPQTHTPEDTEGGQSHRTHEDTGTKTSSSVNPIDAMLAGSWTGGKKEEDFSGDHENGGTRIQDDESPPWIRADLSTFVNVRNPDEATSREQTGNQSSVASLALHVPTDDPIPRTNEGEGDREVSQEQLRQDDPGKVSGQELDIHVPHAEEQSKQTSPPGRDEAETTTMSQTAENRVTKET